MLRNDKFITCNICIIGSGIGGATLAKSLIEKGFKDLVVVEAGGRKASQLDVVSFDSVGEDFRLSPTRAIELGGTSNLWHGVLAPLDPIDFEYRSWIPNSGWPISYEDLDPYYRRAADILKIPKFDWFDRDTITRELDLCISDMPINFDSIENKLFQQPQPVMSFKNELESLEKQGHPIRILTNSVALELLGHSEHQIKAVMTKCTRSQDVTFIHAKKYIVAAGALESPRLFLNSKSKWRYGLGNEQDNVGRYLMDHPMGNLIQVEFNNRISAPLYSDFRASKNVKIKSGIVFDRKHQKEWQLPNHNFYIRPSFIRGINNESEELKLYLLTLKRGKFSIKKILKILSNINVVRQILAYKFSLRVKYKFADIFFVTEQIPYKSSRISLSENKDSFGYPIAKIDWKLHKDDWDSMSKLYPLLKKIFPSDRFTCTHKENDVNWRSIFTSAAHHVGTLRMASSSNNGVVDQNLKVFGVNNLFVCDGSVFPTSGNVNSGLTIAALAIRLGDFLKECET